MLYIDDLDRCPPKRVVEVLAALQLLLALPAFVAVVAVDVRWLELSLRHHFRELVDQQELAEGTLDPLQAVVTPWDYLEKIFQITYALRPMGSRAGSYLEALLPPEAEPSGSPASLGADGAPALRETSVPDTDNRSPEAAHRDPTAVRSAPNIAEPAASARKTASEWGSGDPIRQPVSVAAPTPQSSSARNLQPQGLQVRARERAFIVSLGPLIPSPGLPSD